MTDTEVLSIFENDSGKTVPKRCSWDYLLKTGQNEAIHYLRTRFEDLDGSEKISEILYRIRNQIELRPLCPVCGKPVPYNPYNPKGYGTFCSNGCRLSDDGNSIWHRKACKTIFDRFGSASPFGSSDIREKARMTLMQRYGCSHPADISFVKDKVRQTLICRFGVDNPSKIPGIWKKIRATNLTRYGTDSSNRSYDVKLKKIETSLKKFGTEYSVQSDIVKDKIKATNLMRYGVPVASQSESIRNRLSKALQEPGIQHKRIESCRKNGTLGNHKTLIEKAVEELLVDRFGSDDVKYQYFDKDRYLFHCDFYVRSLDLFIEVNGFWMHGDMPYISGNPVCESLVTDWRKKDQISPRTAVGKKSCYKIAVDTYTRRDPLKRSYAERNGLRYLELFGTDISKINRTLNEFIRRYEHRDSGPGV